MQDQEVVDNRSNVNEIERLLNDHPGSAVTQEQLAALDEAQSESSASLVIVDDKKNVVDISTDFIPGTHVVDGELIKDGTSAKDLDATIKEANQTEEQKREAAQGDVNNVSDLVPEHTHVFLRGLLPGGVYVKTCKVSGCGLRETITYAEWATISDR